MISFASVDDVDQILRLEDQLEKDRYSKEIIESSIIADNYINLVAKIDGVIVGYLSASLVLDECSLLKIVTSLENRRQGVANMLIDNLEEYLCKRDIRVVMLEVRTDNIAAINLYKKTGFRLDGVRKKYYIDCDAELYSKELNGKRN